MFAGAAFTNPTASLRNLQSTKIARSSSSSSRNNEDDDNENEENSDRTTDSSENNEATSPTHHPSQERDDNESEVVVIINHINDVIENFDTLFARIAPVRKHNFRLGDEADHLQIQSLTPSQCDRVHTMARLLKFIHGRVIQHSNSGVDTGNNLWPQQQQQQQHKRQHQVSEFDCDPSVVTAECDRFGVLSSNSTLTSSAVDSREMQKKYNLLRDYLVDALNRNATLDKEKKKIESEKDDVVQKLVEKEDELVKYRQQQQQHSLQSNGSASSSNGRIKNHPSKLNTAIATSDAVTATTPTQDPQRYVDRFVRKEFDAGLFFGLVVEFHIGEEDGLLYFYVVFEDDDAEDILASELPSYLWKSEVPAEVQRKCSKYAKQHLEERAAADDDKISSSSSGSNVSSAQCDSRNNSFNARGQSSGSNGGCGDVESAAATASSHQRRTIDAAASLAATDAVVYPTSAAVDADVSDDSSDAASASVAKKSKLKRPLSGDEFDSENSDHNFRKKQKKRKRLMEKVKMAKENQKEKQKKLQQQQQLQNTSELSTTAAMSASVAGTERIGGRLTRKNTSSDEHSSDDDLFNDHNDDSGSKLLVKTVASTIGNDGYRELLQEGKRKSTSTAAKKSNSSAEVLDLTMDD